MKTTLIKQNPKSYLTAILSSILRKNKNSQTKDCINKDTIQPTSDLLYNQYLDFFKKHPNSTIRSRAILFRLTKYRSEILTAKVKNELKNECNMK